MHAHRNRSGNCLEKNYYANLIGIDGDNQEKVSLKSLPALFRDKKKRERETSTQNTAQTSSTVVDLRSIFQEVVE